jgi:hypothetical protein
MNMLRKYIRTAEPRPLSATLVTEFVKRLLEEIHRFLDMRSLDIVLRCTHMYTQIMALIADLKRIQFLRRSGLINDSNADPDQRILSLLILLIPVHQSSRRPTLAKNWRTVHNYIRN